ncbi:DUF5988 family protein [Streptomyces sp. NPDC058953]|uniref:DUF5988 family protein n=1 Tax=unclassified Streptomyces TaxID=2593676 RepID=UPI00368C9CA9
MTVARPNVVLRGCTSPYLAEEQRIRHVPDPGEKVKFLFGNRYEHFVATSEWVNHEGETLRVFAWAGATSPAE